MERAQQSQVVHLGEALVTLRAAIDVVASQAATRVTVHTDAGANILRLARTLARTAGVSVEPIWWPDEAGCDLVICSEAGPAADG